MHILRGHPECSDELDGEYSDADIEEDEDDEETPFADFMINMLNQEGIRESVFNHNLIIDRQIRATKVPSGSPSSGPQWQEIQAALEDDDSSINSVTALKDDLMRINFDKMGLKIRLESLDSNVREGIYQHFTSMYSIYDPIKEFARMNVPDKDWKITYINENYQFSHTYPAILSVPQSITDINLPYAAKFRSKNRFPTLSWRSNVNFCTICRSSQPMVGLAGVRNAHDEALISEISRSSGTSSHAIKNSMNEFVVSSRKGPYVIVDARPLINSLINQAAGKGSENEKYYENTIVVFLGIPNIHVIRKSYETLF
jgi:hypothetical protein